MKKLQSTAPTLPFAHHNIDISILWQLLLLANLIPLLPNQEEVAAAGPPPSPPMMAIAIVTSPI